MILSAQTIMRMRLVSPLVDKTVMNGKSYGLSACGYDIRCKQSVLLSSPDARVIDARLQRTARSFELASTVEYFNIPDNVCGIVHDKLSWARLGLAVQNTVLEPGWRGYLTLELSNHSPAPLYIQEGEPIAQVVFHFLDEPTMRPYNGKYQDQPDYPVPHIEEK